MLDLYLVRHAESEMQLSSHLICGRSPHTPLSAHGRIQARLLGERLASEGIQFDEVMLPPAVRHYQTYEGVRPFIGGDTDVVITDVLHELHKGEWDGKDREVMLKAHPEVRTQAERQGVDFCLPGGESMREKGRTSLEWASELATINQSKERHSVLAISSGGTITLLVWALFGRDDKFALKPEIENTSITHLRHTDEWQVIGMIGDCTHRTPAAFPGRGS